MRLSSWIVAVAGVATEGRLSFFFWGGTGRESWWLGVWEGGRRARAPRGTEGERGNVQLQTHLLWRQDRNGRLGSDGDMVMMMLGIFLPLQGAPDGLY